MEIDKGQADDFFCINFHVQLSGKKHTGHEVVTLPMGSHEFSPDLSK